MSVERVKILVPHQSCLCSSVRFFWLDEIMQYQKFPDKISNSKTANSPMAKGQKRARGRSRVCPNFYCSLLFTRMCTLILWNITCHPNILRNCNKSLDILHFYLLALCRRTKNEEAPWGIPLAYISNGSTLV